MNKRSNIFPAAVAAAVVLLTFSLPALPQAVEGREYAPLSPAQAPETTGKTEVIEFFSYGCPHCYHLHPLISQWSAQLPADVNFIRIPVSMGHAQWGQLVRAYYALQATGDLARLDTALFDAIHKERQPLFNEANLTAWAAQHGVDAAKFTAAFNSFNVSTKASHAEQLSRDYKVDGIPQIVVAGKYIVLGNNFEKMLANASQVIGKATQGSPGTKAGK
jgi:thiol:disulfide interchange protein DsbA